MMFAGVVFLLSLFVAAVHGVSSAADLVGTWTTKSRSVVTGPVWFMCLYAKVTQWMVLTGIIRDSLIRSMTG